MYKLVRYFNFGKKSGTFTFMLFDIYIIASLLWPPQKLL